MFSSVSQTSEQFEFSKCLYVVRPLKAKATMASEKKNKKKQKTDRQTDKTKQNKSKEKHSKISIT